jgi:hypothetical protein
MNAVVAVLLPWAACTAGAAPLLPAGSRSQSGCRASSWRSGGQRIPGRFSEIDANGIVAREWALARPAALAGKGIMFTIIRKFRLTRGSAVEVSRRVREGFVPLGLTCSSAFACSTARMRRLPPMKLTATWMRENVREFVKGMPEVMAGNVLVAADK